MPVKRYDAIIIGAGQGGVPLARSLASAGRSTALIEHVHIGGTCVNEGCTPTKTMVASARVAYLTRRASEYGVMNSGWSVDMKKVRLRKRDMVESFRSSNEKRIKEEKNLDLYMGKASFTGMKTLQVEMKDGTTEELSSDTIFINTGTRPDVPGIEGIRSVTFLNSTSIMELDRVPRHLLIVGGGYIGLEFGQMFSRFGSQVTIVHRGAQLVPREDEDVAGEVLHILQEDGIEVILNSQPVSVTQEKDGTIAMKVKKLSGNSGNEEMTLRGSHLLLAAGRVPNTEYLNPGRTDVQINERGFVKVNDRLETTVSDIYAIGDVKGGPAFTHISYDDYRILRTNILEGGNATIKDRLVPYTIFIDPQLGRVGLSEKEARSRGMHIRVAKIPMTYVARALEAGETRGLMKAIVDADSGRILGCAILSVEGGELMAIIQMAMMGGVSYTALRDGVFAHPTLAESLNTLFSYFV